MTGPTRSRDAASEARTAGGRPQPSGVPAACTLEAAGARERIAAWRQLASRAQLGVSDSPGAVTVTYQDLPGIAGELRRLADAERQCCPFLSFEVTRSPGQAITLAITASPQADPATATGLGELASLFTQAGSSSGGKQALDGGAPGPGAVTW